MIRICRTAHGTFLAIVVFSAMIASAEQRYPVKGLVVKVDQSHRTVVVSCQSIPGVMEAMTMPFTVRNAKEMDGLIPGTMIDFTLVVETNSSYAEGIHVHTYQGLEPDPLTARRLKLLHQATDPSAAKPLNAGERVPNFTLTDQNRRSVTFSTFAGKVVALNFIYTRCSLPNFCFRTTNNFGNVQKRFKDRLGRDLILLTVTFDPEHDQPEVLAKYAETWKADPKTWHFLTGSAPDVRRVCDAFGVDFFRDEGSMNHSLHTAVIDRKGRLVANLEGNEATAEQLGDLIGTVLNGTAKSNASRSSQ